MLFNVVGSNDLTLHEVTEAAEVVGQAVDPKANIIFGVAKNSNMANDVMITLIATGFVSKTEFSEAKDEDELTQQLKRLKNEDELDVPSFLRRPLFSRQRQAITPSDKVSKIVSHD